MNQTTAPAPAGDTATVTLIGDFFTMTVAVAFDNISSDDHDSLIAAATSIVENYYGWNVDSFVTDATVDVSAPEGTLPPEFVCEPYGTESGEICGIEVPDNGDNCPAHAAEHADYSHAAAVLYRRR